MPKMGASRTGGAEPRPSPIPAGAAQKKSGWPPRPFRARIVIRESVRVQQATDETLLRRGRNGDSDAFRVLLERHAPGLQAYFDQELPAYLRRKISVADLTQEVRLTVVEGCNGFEDRGPGSVRAWLYGIARMKLRTTLRHHIGVQKRAAGREVTRGQRPDTEFVVGDGATPSQHAIASESAERACDAFAQLPDDYREIIRLVRDEQLSLDAAGERMARSRDAAKKLYARALHRFARLFDESTERDDG